MVILTIITGPNSRISSEPITRTEASQAVATVFNVPADVFAACDKVQLRNGWTLMVEAN